MEATEAALIRRCQAGEKEAFEPIVRKYAGRAAGAATVLLGCPHDALDASQEAFVRAWRHIKRFDPAYPFYPWYSAILRNICRTRLRRRARRKTVTLADGHASPSSNGNPVVLAEQTERRKRLFEAILTLKPAFREIILLKHFNDMSYKEMAEALDIPIGTVMSRLHHARQALREALEGTLCETSGEDGS
jgi:RNA polymerase sigma-70 factor (ECF subfamily)